MLVKELKKIVASLGRVVVKKAVVPVLSNLYLKDGYLVSSNMDVTIRIYTGLKGEGYIPYGDLKKMLDKTDEAEIAFRWEKGILKVTLGKDVFTFDGCAPDGLFPEISDEMHRTRVFKSFNVDGELLDMCGYCSQDDMRDVLMCIYFGEKHLVATDAYIMAWKDYEGAAENAFMVKGEYISLLEKDCAYLVTLLKHDKKHASPYYVCFDDGMKAEYIFRITEGKYPDYERVIPENNTNGFTFGRKAMLKKLEMAMISVNQITKRINLGFSDGNTSITVDNRDLGKGFRAKVPTEKVSGKPVQEHYNASYLIKLLKSLKEDKVTVHIGRTGKASLFGTNRLIMPLTPND